MTEQELELDENLAEKSEEETTSVNTEKPTRFMKPTKNPVPKVMLDAFRRRFELQICIVKFKDYVKFSNRCQRKIVRELPEEFYIECVSDDNVYREEEFHNSMMRQLNHAKDIVVTVEEIEPTVREKMSALFAKELKRLNN